MTALDWYVLSLATVMSIAGLTLLFLSWKRPGKPARLVAGWGLLAGAVIAACIGNADRGVAQIAVIAMMAALVCFSVPMLKGLTPPRAASRRRHAAAPGQVKRPVRATIGGLWTFIVCGPVAGAIAFYGGAVLFKLLRPENGNPVTAGVIALIAALTGWAIVSTLLLIEPRTGRRSAYAGAALAAVVTAALV